MNLLQWAFVPRKGKKAVSNLVLMDNIKNNLFLYRLNVKNLMKTNIFVKNFRSKIDKKTWKPFVSSYITLNQINKKCRRSETLLQKQYVAITKFCNSCSLPTIFVEEPVSNNSALCDVLCSNRKSVVFTWSVLTRMRNPAAFGDSQIYKRHKKNIEFSGPSNMLGV